MASVRIVGFSKCIVKTTGKTQGELEKIEGQLFEIIQAETDQNTSLFVALAEPRLSTQWFVSEEDLPKTSVYTDNEWIQLSSQTSEAEQIRDQRIMMCEKRFWNSVIAPTLSTGIDLEISESLSWVPLAERFRDEKNGGGGGGGESTLSAAECVDTKSEMFRLLEKQFGKGFFDRLVSVRITEFPGVFYSSTVESSSEEFMIPPGILLGIVLDNPQSTLSNGDIISEDTLNEDVALVRSKFYRNEQQKLHKPLCNLPIRWFAVTWKSVNEISKQKRKQECVISIPPPVKPYFTADASSTLSETYPSIVEFNPKEIQVVFLNSAIETQQTTNTMTMLKQYPHAQPPQMTLPLGVPGDKPIRPLVGGQYFNGQQNHLRIDENIHARIDEIRNQKELLKNREIKFAEHITTQASSFADAFECHVCGSSEVSIKWRLTPHAPCFLLCSSENCKVLSHELINILSKIPSGEMSKHVKQRIKRLYDKVPPKHIDFDNFSKTNHMALSLLLLKSSLGSLAPEETITLSQMRNVRGSPLQLNNLTKNMHYTTYFPELVNNSLDQQQQQHYYVIDAMTLVQLSNQGVILVQHPQANASLCISSIDGDSESLYFRQIPAPKFAPENLIYWIRSTEPVNPSQQQQHQILGKITAQRDIVYVIANGNDVLIPTERGISITRTTQHERNKFNLSNRDLEVFCVSKTRV
jgi:hypothetical protein